VEEERIVTPAERRSLIARYASGPTLLRDTLARVPPSAMHWKPAPDKWSAHEVAVHCADSETNATMRIRYLVGEQEPTLAGYDQDHWARVFDYASLPVELSLAQIDASRAWTTVVLERLPDSAWARSGTHTESGRYTAEKWLAIYAEHLEVHARQILRNVEAFERSRK
jgi:hypothetical protein